MLFTQQTILGTRIESALLVVEQSVCPNEYVET